jgi:Fe-S cluster assembly ATP-binding protein
LARFAENVERRAIEEGRKKGKFMSLLQIQDLHVEVTGHEILKGVTLKVNAGEVHSIMGPNGSGKSTLAQVLARRERYQVTAGRILFNGKDLLAMKPEEAACEGIFMAFQYPVEIPGIGNAYFLRSARNAIRKYRGEDEMDAMDFLPMFREKVKLLEMDEKLMNRSVNEGFSGGEKKRNEILQMAVLEPKLAILDETDSGLDIDALRIVAHGVNAMRSPDRAMLVVTHYQRLLNYIVPDFVHVLIDGRIVRSGGPELALELEAGGYGSIESAGRESVPVSAEAAEEGL